MKKKSQNERILAYLKTGKTLTPLNAFRMFGCFRLAARIWDLRGLDPRGEGLPFFDIETVSVKTKSGAVVATYKMVQ
jgi:hypothetical protein